ncbi:MAG TPA: hypothetical protein VMZ53_28480 [Kofleriaceae bacterium]|nr:hypothetical protein [Kofleriaceae bacterium]
MRRFVCLLVLAACQPKQPLQASYFHAKPVEYASCQDTVTCYARCSPVTEPCMQACDRNALPDDALHARDLTSCLQNTRCRDESCTREQCGIQIDTCNNARQQMPGQYQTQGGPI